MKKILSLFAAVLFAGSMFADPIVINATDVEGIESGATGDFSTKVSGIDLVWNGAYYNNENNQDIRVYAGKTLTLSASEAIQKVEIAGYAKKDLEVSVDNGNVTTGASYSSETTKKTLDDPLIVVEGINAKSVTLSCTKQMRAFIIRVTIDGEVTPPDPQDEGVVYDWAKKVGVTFLGASGVEESKVKIHENTDEVPAIKFGNSYKYEEGKYIAIKPAEGGFKAGDELNIAICFSNDDDTKEAQAAVYAADGETQLFLSEKAINARTSGADPKVESYILTADADSLIIGRKGNTGLFVISLAVKRAPEPETRPSTAPAAPTRDEADVMALYCNHYAENNLNFNVLGWGGVTTWETLSLEGTNILACQDMKWEILTNWDAESYDVSEYENLHVDVWAPAAAKVKVTFEAKSGTKPNAEFTLAQGWNAIDAPLSVWGDYDFKDMKYIIFEGYQTPEGESFENNPFAFTNIYFFGKKAGKVTIDIEFEVDYVDMVDEEGWWQFMAENDDYEISISNVATTQAAGVYTIEDLDADYTYITIKATEEEIAFVDGSLTLSEGEDGSRTIEGELTGSDGNIYAIKLVFHIPTAETTVNVEIPEWGVEDASEYYGIEGYIFYGETEDESIYVQLTILDSNPIGSFTLDDCYAGGTGIEVEGAYKSVYSMDINVTVDDEENVFVTADILCLNNTLYHVTTRVAHGIDGVNAAMKAVKVLRDGQVQIIKGDKTYNVLGVQVR